MVKVQVGLSYPTELHQNILQAKALEVDASLVLVQFPGGQTEWIYRGSERFGPLSDRVVSNHL